MNSQVRVLNEAEVQQISGGHPTVGALGITMLILELPHIFMGFREFVNYVGERISHGCEHLEEDDYFTYGLCSAYQSITGVFK